MITQRRTIAIVVLIAIVLAATGIGGAYAFDKWNDDTGSAANAGELPNNANGTPVLTNEEAERAANVGKRLIDADDTPILTINGQTVTYQDYAYEVGKAEYTLATMKAAVAQGPDQGELTPQQEEIQRDWIETIERVGVKNVAMGSLIAETTTYQWATSEGFGASDEEITGEIEQQRQNQERIAGTKTGGMQQAFIDVVGEDRYWTEILPWNVERQIVLSKAKQAVVTGENGSAGDARAWTELTVELVKSVEIRVGSSGEIDPETVKRGRQYIVEDYADLQEQRQAPDQP